MNDLLKERIELANQCLILDIRNLDLTAIPEEVFALTNLKVMLLDNNQIEDIPSNIQKMKHLKYLSASGNQIQTFPLFILHMPSLRISEMTIEALDYCVDSLLLESRHNAKYYNFSLLQLIAYLLVVWNICKSRYDRQESLNKHYDNKTHRLFVNFTDNPLANIPEQVIDSGSEAILEYISLSAPSDIP